MPKWTREGLSVVAIELKLEVPSPGDLAELSVSCWMEDVFIILLDY